MVAHFLSSMQCSPVKTHWVSVFLSRSVATWYSLATIEYTSFSLHFKSFHGVSLGHCEIILYGVFDDLAKAHMYSDLPVSSATFSICLIHSSKSMFYHQQFVCFFINSSFTCLFDISFTSETFVAVNFIDYSIWNLTCIIQLSLIQCLLLEMLNDYIIGS